MFYLDEYDDFLTIPQICQILRIGRTKCYELLRSNQIKNFKINNTFKVCKESIQEYISTNGYTKCDSNMNN